VSEPLYGFSLASPRRAPPMKLDVNVLRHLTRDDFRTLTAVEQGQKNVRKGTEGGEAAACGASGGAVPTPPPASGRVRARH
jgi:hypothetical protein